MKTEAERQKLSRERKKASENRKQINLWISTDAHLSLRMLAKNWGISHTDALDKLLVSSAQSIAVTSSQSNQKKTPRKPDNAPPNLLKRATVTPEKLPSPPISEENDRLVAQHSETQLNSVVTQKSPQSQPSENPKNVNESGKPIATLSTQQSTPAPPTPTQGSLF